MKKGMIVVVGLALLCSFKSKDPEKSRWTKDSAVLLQHHIEKVIQTVDPNVHVGVDVVSLDNDQRLFQKNSQQLFVPASTLKIITAATALHVLGVEYRFNTKLLSDGAIDDHLLKGNLYVKGSGDPELTVRSLEDLAFQLKLQGVQTVDGNLCIDISDFDEIAQGPGWMWDEGAEFWNSPLDALTINHSCVDIWVKPNKDFGKPPLIYLNPKTDYVIVQNKALTSVDEHTLKVERRWMTKENVIEIKGEIPAHAKPYQISIPVEVPHMYAAFVLRDILSSHGITVSGQIIVKKAPERATELASHSSRPLSLIVEHMMKTSDNLAADMLFKKIGQVSFGAPGTWSKGTRAVREFLTKQISIDVERTVIMDGSGLSRYNLIAPYHIVQALQYMNKQFLYSSEFCASLPISGVDGSLALRMISPSIKGKVRAKTGSMTGISTICGYVTTKEGEVLAFSIMINGFTQKQEAFKAQLEDEICALLANYSTNTGDKKAVR